MRLVQATADGSFSLAKYEGPSIPPYAILSHTWGSDEEEVTYDDVRGETGRGKFGYAKLVFCAEQAAKDGLKHFWIDTCCIDKSSSAELSEAITSMFRWYKNSDRCYVYLSDVTTNKRKADHESAHPAWMSAFRSSRWFARGWTLQELLAPRTVNFFSREGKELGTRSDLEQHIHEITRIPIPALRGVPLHQFTVSDRMSWAATRRTKREEDKAYSLLGIFGVSMVPNYGEEEEAAFRRLRREIREIAGDDTTSLDEEEKSMFMDTLRFDQLDARHTTIKKAHAKTCQWLLRKREYEDWLDATKLPQHHGFLWIKGKPGTGKSTLMKFAFGRTIKSRAKKHTVVIAFFFNARGEALEKSVIGLYRSLLLQLLEQVPSLQCTFRSSSLSRSSINPEHQWSINSLEAQLEEAVLSLGNTPVICFIDALDECDQRQVRSMISFFENTGELAVSSGISFRVCFSSRYYPEITIKKGSLTFELEGSEGHTEDINNYLKSELDIGNSAIAQTVRADLQERASGVFMWVVLVVDILQREYDRGRMYALKQRLRDIPADLHQLFHDILTRDSHDKEHLILSIQWVLFAKEPLSPEQLYFAILSGVEPELVSQWNFGVVSEQDTIRRFILDASKGLTEITKSRSQKVQFIHESVRDFLLKDDGLGRVWPDLRDNFEGQSHERLKQCCLTIMSPNVEGCVRFPSDFDVVSLQEMTNVRTAVTQAFPLLDYAVQNILHHADTAQGAGVDQTNFMASIPLDRWIKYANLFEKHKVRRHTRSTTLLYILGERNMPNLIRSFASVTSCFEVGSERYGAPFLAAIATKSNEAICAFVDSLNKTCGQRSCSPESYVCYYQSKDGQSLLPRDFKYPKQKNIVDVLRNLGDGSALCLAIAANIITADMRVANTRTSDGSTLLTWAARTGRRDVVDALISNGQVDVRGHNGLILLFAAAQFGHKDVLERLLSTTKFDVEPRNNEGLTLLMIAAQYGHKEVMKMLLSTYNADAEARSNDGLTPLMLAARHGHGHIIELLLSSTEVDVDARSNEGLTPIILSARAGHQDTLKLLLRYSKAGINSKDNNGRSALSWVASVAPLDTLDETLLPETGSAALMDYQLQLMLLERQNKKRLLASEGFLSGDRGPMLRLLLSTEEADVNSEDDSGRTPLFWAALRGNVQCVELLLNTGRVNLEKRDNIGYTVLRRAMDLGHVKICELLRSHLQCPPNTEVWDGRVSIH